MQRRMGLLIDSCRFRACDDVIKPSELLAYTDSGVETEASIHHQDFVAATGDSILNYGELKIPLVAREQTL